MTNPILTDSQQMLDRALAAKDAEIERLRAAYQKQIEHNRFAAEKHSEHIHELGDRLTELRERLEAAERSAREMHIAADRFARERDKLRAENERLRGTCEWQLDNDRKNAETISRLLSENRRLRAALNGALVFFDESQRSDWDDADRAQAAAACRRLLERSSGA